MSAPITDLSSSSISSSGHVDGLGRRSLAFDRESGAMLERLYVRPELAVFEQLLKRRAEQIQPVEDERIARPRGVERDPSTGELVVVAEFVAGSRLSELLEVSSDESVVPGVDVALGYLLDGLEGLSSLHTVARVTHGLIDPSRTVLTADGQVVFLDVAFGSAIERLHLPAHRLWIDFGAAGPPPSEPARFDATRDVTQMALSALMLVLGRNLRRNEYPDALPSLLMEVIEVAQIRGSSGFAASLQRFMQRSLPLPGRRPFVSADEALVELRQLVRREIGVDVCRQSVVDFVAQMDAAFANGADRDEPGHAADAHGTNVPELDRFLDTFETRDLDAAGSDSHEADYGSHHHPEADAHAHTDDDDADDGAEELEISLEQLDAQPARTAPAKDDVEEVYELSSLDEFGLTDPGAVSSELASYQEKAAVAPLEPEAPHVEAAAEYEPEPAAEPSASPDYSEPEEPDHFLSAVELSAVEQVVNERTEPAYTEKPDDGYAPAAEPDDTHDSHDTHDEAAAPPAETETEAEKESHSSRRRKRQQQKSARARKDKLRSTTDQKAPPPPLPPAPPPPPPPPRPATPSGWLVSPQRAAASEMLIPESAPPPVRHVPSVPSFSPSPVGTFAQPTYASPGANTSPYGSPSVIKPAPPAPKPVVVQPPAVTPTPVKIKAEPTPVGMRRPPDLTPSPVDRFSTLSLGGAADESEPTRAFPWKLALVALAVAALAIVLGRSYLPGRSAVPGEAGAQTAQTGAAAAAPSGAAAAQTPANDSPIPAGKGRISVQTQPPGIKVLLDRKPIGDTPVQVDTTPGRHVLTFMTSGGEVAHNLRVTAGKVTALDIPVFSGWLTVVSPFVVDLAENGQSIGSSEENRLMLPPGRHRIMMSNRELGFSQAQDIDIEPGGVRSVTINPKGAVNLNASPWAEVWLEGTKLGETPVAGVQVPLGTREFIFKNPQYGEKRITATIRGNAPATIAHDFQKQ